MNSVLKMRAVDQRCKRTVVVVGIDSIDALVLDSADPRAEAQAQYGEGGEVDLGIAVGVGIMLFDLELALVVKQTVQYKGSITVGALNRQAVEGGVVIGHESVKLQGEVAESGAVGLLENATR